MKNILIIHPDDKSTFFLNRIKSKLKQDYNDIIHFYNVKPNDLSHKNCIKLVANEQKIKLVVFLGHGKSDTLCGSKGNLYDGFGYHNEILLQEEPKDFYYNEHFINESNLENFKGKNIFCLSCNSNEKIALDAINAGVISFIGFGNIPTSIDEFKKLKYEYVSSDLVRSMKTEINYIIKTSLHLAIKHDFSIIELEKYIKFISNQRISDILINNKKYKDRYILADNIYLFMKEMKIFGNKDSKLIL